MKIQLKHNSFQLEFRHITKLGRRAELRNGSVKAVTTCVIIATGINYDPPLTAIDNALCADEDNFSRREGRARALKKALERCTSLRAFRTEIWVGFHLQTSGRVVDLDSIIGQAGELLIPQQTKRPKPRLSAEQIVERRLAGEAKHHWRKSAKVQRA